MKEWYYRLNIQKAIEDGMSDTELSMLFGSCTHYIIKVNVSSDSVALYKYSNIPTSALDNLKASIAGKIINNYPMYMETHKDSKIYPTYIYGDYYTRIYHMSAFLGGAPDITEIKQMLDPYMTEISKEEYEELIEWPSVIL